MEEIHPHHWLVSRTNLRNFFSAYNLQVTIQQTMHAPVKNTIKFKLLRFFGFWTKIFLNHPDSVTLARTFFHLAVPSFYKKKKKKRGRTQKDFTEECVTKERIGLTPAVKTKNKPFKCFMSNFKCLIIFCASLCSSTCQRAVFV